MDSFGEPSLMEDPAARRREVRAASAPFTWIGDAAALRRLAIANAWRTAASCGAYSFWAKVAWRRSLWGSLAFQGRPLTFTGTVRDALMPFLVVLAAVAATIAAVAALKWFGTPRPPVPGRPVRLMVSIPIVFLLGLSAWRHRAFLLSRTSIAGIAGRLEGSPLVYALMHFGTAVLTPLSLGLILPWRQAWLQRLLIGGTELGGERFSLGEFGAGRLVWRLVVVLVAGVAVYVGAVLAIAVSPLGAKIARANASGMWFFPTGGELAYLVAIVLACGLVLTVAIAWYRLAALRVLVSATRIGGRPLRFDVTAGQFIRAAVYGFVVRAGSLTLLAPLAEMRTARLMAAGIVYADAHSRSCGEAPSSLS